ncbi:MAG: hypothetical protein R3F40_06895 [Candidatus Competibacteraceae bacterium]
MESEPDLRAIVGGADSQQLLERPAPDAGLDSSIVEHPEEAAHFDAFASVKNLKAGLPARFVRAGSTSAQPTILTGQAVHDFVADPDRPERSLGVRTEDGSEFRAGVVLLAAGALYRHGCCRAIQPTAARRAAAVRMGGRNYKSHLLSAVLAFSATPKTDLLAKNSARC